MVVETQVLAAIVESLDRGQGSKYDARRSRTGEKAVCGLHLPRSVPPPVPASSPSRVCTIRR